MITTALPDQSALLIGLKEYVQDVLGETHYQPIGFDRAEAIVKITKNAGLCYVQFPSADCPEITVPLLWKFAAWADAVERNKQSRLRAERERIASEIREENIIRIKRGILKTMQISDAHANVLARKWLDKGRFQAIAAFEVKLVTTKEELP